MHIIIIIVLLFSGINFAVNKNTQHSLEKSNTPISTQNISDLTEIDPDTSEKELDFTITDISPFAKAKINQKPIKIKNYKNKTGQVKYKIKDLKDGENKFELEIKDGKRHKTQTITLKRLTKDEFITKKATENSPNQPNRNTPPPQNAPPFPDSTSKETFPVHKVIDGDTIEINYHGKIEKIRMIGLNTPETKDPRKPMECFGKEASQKMSSLLSGKKVYIEKDPTQGERDKYGRLLLYLYTEEKINVAYQMLYDGYGYEYTYKIPYKYQSYFKSAQKDAESNKRGLWADHTCNGKKSFPAAPQSAPATQSTAPQSHQPQNQSSHAPNIIPVPTPITPPQHQTPSPQPAPQPLPSETTPSPQPLPLKAICRDGTVQYQDDPHKPNYRGMCSGHKGIAQKLGRIP